MRTKKFKLPSPNNRPANDPREIVTKDRVLGIYNQDPLNKPAKYVGKTVREYFVEKALNELKWDEAVFTGNTCQLEADLPIR